MHNYYKLSVSTYYGGMRCNATEKKTDISETCVCGP